MKSFFSRGLLLALLVVTFPSLSKDGAADHSRYAMEQLIDKAVTVAWPVDYGLFHEIGASGFTQVNGSDAINIAFRSNAIESGDGFKVDYVEYRVRPSLDNGATFLYLKINADACFPLERMKSKFDLQPVLDPPNPHSRQAGVQADIYSVDIKETKVRFLAAKGGQGCLLSVSRSM